VVSLVDVALQPQEEELYGEAHLTHLVPQPWGSLLTQPVWVSCLAFTLISRPVWPRVFASPLLPHASSSGLSPLLRGCPWSRSKHDPQGGNRTVVQPGQLCPPWWLSCVTAALSTARRTHSHLGALLPADFYINGVLHFTPRVPLGFRDWGAETQLPPIVPLPAMALG